MFKKNQYNQNNYIITIFILIIIAYFLNYFPGDLKGYGLNIWVYTEWLFDYSNGFIRRGLSGEIIKIFNPIAGPMITISLINWLIIIIIAYNLIKLVKSKINNFNSLTLIFLLFLPNLFLFYIYDHDAFARKELVGILILLFHINYVLKKTRLKNRGIDLIKNGLNDIEKIIYSILCVAVISISLLIHEGMFLMFIPFHIYITFQFLFTLKVNNLKILKFLAVIYIPITISFLFTIFFGQVNFDTAFNISKNWHDNDLLMFEYNSEHINKKDSWALPGAFIALPWTPKQAIDFTLNSATIKRVLSYLSIFIFFGFATLILSRRVILEQEYNISERHSNLLFLIPLVITAPLYIIGADWGRWFVVHCFIFIIIIISGLSNNKTDNSKGKKYKINRKIYNVYIETILLTSIIFLRIPHGWIATETLFIKPLSRWVKYFLGFAGL